MMRLDKLGTKTRYFIAQMQPKRKTNDYLRVLLHPIFERGIAGLILVSVF